MRERRGTFGRTVGALATSIADAARGRQQRGETRVVVHDEAGHSRLLDSGTPEYERLVETALALLDTVAEGRAPS